MKRTLIAIFCILPMLVHSVFGQQADVVPQITQTTKIEEFARAIGECELGARIDNLLVYLLKNPDSKGYFVLYNGLDQLPAEYDYQPERALLVLKYRITDYIAFRGFKEQRIDFIDGGFREKAGNEIWIVPDGEAPPKPANTIPKPTLPVDRTFLYDSNSLIFPDGDIEPYEFLLPIVKAELDKFRREIDAETKTEANDENNEVLPLAKQEIEEMKFFWVNEKFGEVIRSQPESKGVIIFYADDSRLDVKKIKRRIEEGKKKIAKAAKISQDRIQVLYGGYRNEIQAEFWFVPKKGDEPRPKPEEKTN